MSQLAKTPTSGEPAMAPSSDNSCPSELPITTSSEEATPNATDASHPPTSPIQHMSSRPSLLPQVGNNEEGQSGRSPPRSSQTPPEVRTAVGEGDKPRTPPRPSSLPLVEDTPEGLSDRTPPRSSQTPSGSGAASEEGDEPGVRPPTPPGGGPGDDPPPPASPAPLRGNVQDDRLTKAIKDKLRDIRKAKTTNPMVKDLNTIIDECLNVDVWEDDIKQHTYQKIDETMKRHRPRLWEEPTQEQIQPRRANNEPF